MNPVHWSVHAKHILIALIAFGGIVGGLAVRGKYESEIADRMAKRDEQISANQAKVADAQKTVQNAQQANTAIDSQTKAQIAQLQQQLASKPDTAQIRAIVEAIGVKTVAGTDNNGVPIIGVADTQANRDAFNKASVDYKTCQLNLGDCQAKQANLNTIIAAQNTELGADKDTIALQMKQINQLSKFQVPRHTLFFGAGKTQGTSFQSAQSYQPVIGYGFRLTNRLGFMAIAQNKSAAIGGTWNFGGTK